jgi:hypothetical protein
MSCRWRRSAGGLAVVLVVAGCGSSSEPSATGAARATATATATPAPASRQCASRAQAASGATGTRVTAVSPGQATCVYEGPGLRVDVSVDSNPQAEFRFERAVVERGQNAVWGSNLKHMPRLIHGVGQGADWFPLDRELLTTDGRRLISVKLVHSRKHASAALHLSMAVARATLAS